LGIINVDKTGERVATLAKAFGMQVLLYSEIPFRMEGMERQSLDEVLYKSDLLVLNLPDTKENEGFMNKERIGRLKKNAIVINMAGKDLVDEKAMSKALLKGDVSQYVFEAIGLRKSPLENVETAIRLKPFSKLTIDSLMMNREWVAKNVLGLSVGRPHNRVVL
jgi:lactate dehydrogenase-like 2-hydroxyacid dehydrogenase